MRSQYPQLSEWSLEEYATSHHQNSSNNSNHNHIQRINAWSNNITEDSSRNQQRTRYKRSLAGKCLKCCSSLSPFYQGLIAGVLTGLLMLIVILPLWLISIDKTSVTTTMTTTFTTVSKTTTTTTTTTSTTVSTSTTTTTTTTKTTTTTGMSLLTSTNETIFPVWNTKAGGNSSPSTAGSGIGNYFPGEVPKNVFDRNSNTKYTNFGDCTNFFISATAECGENTGFYFTPLRGLSLLVSLRFGTANDFPKRDPLTVTLEGSNQPSSALIQGSSWTLIYNGSTGLDTNPGRYAYGTTQNLSSNFIWYLSYRLLITSKRDVQEAVQYAEVEFICY